MHNNISPITSMYVLVRVHEFCMCNYFIAEEKDFKVVVTIDQADGMTV